MFMKILGRGKGMKIHKSLIDNLIKQKQILCSGQKELVSFNRLLFVCGDMYAMNLEERVISQKHGVVLGKFQCPKLHHFMLKKEYT